MKAYVIDASFLVEACTVRGNARREMKALLAASKKGQAELLAPDLLLYEVASAFSAGPYQPEQLDLLYRHLQLLQITSIGPSLARLRYAMETAKKNKTSVYQMSYHQLAIVRGAIFLTCNAQYFALAKELGSIELVSIA